MARRRTKRRERVIHSRPIERDFSPIASGSKLLDPFQVFGTPVFFQPVEDRRTFHPDGPFRAARTWSGRPSFVRSSARPDFRARSKTWRIVSSVIEFNAPRQVLVCVRRHRRREVLFAKRRTGRGSRSPRRRNWFSSISCRR